MLPRLRATALGFALSVGVWIVPTVGVTAPADDWELQREASHPTLVSQRLAKLRRNPFDEGQWRALTRTLGSGGLDRAISRALASSPGDLALEILAARAAMAAGNPGAAVDLLGPLEARAGRWQTQVFRLRVRALEAAGDPAAAVAAWRRRANETSGASARYALLQAWTVADRAGMAGEALDAAKTLAAAAPTDAAAQLRVARAAARAGEPALADRSYSAALAHTPPRQRDDVTVERAKARLDGGDAPGAADLLWELVADPRRGSRALREDRWVLLAEAHRRAQRSAALVTRLEGWLVRNPKDAGAWRAQARALDAAGQDPHHAWRQALALDPRDEQTHAALMDNLQRRGDSEAAVAEYRRWAARHPRQIQEGLDLAASLLQGPDRDRGLALAAELARQAGARPEALAALLEFYNLGDEPDLALAMAERLVAASPRSAMARVALGEQLYQMGRTVEAMAQWARIPKLIRPAHRGWARHAEVLGEHGLLGDAVEALNVALKLAPQEPSYIRLRAVFAEEQRRHLVALELWLQVMELAQGPGQSRLRDEARTRAIELLVDGLLPSRAEKLARAEFEARKVFETGERDEALDAGRFLAELYTRRELHGLAVEVLSRLANTDPSNPDRLADLAAAQRRAGRPVEASATLTQLLEHAPSRRAEVMAELSELALEAGESAQAMALAIDAVTADGHDVEALVRLGELQERQGDLDLAAAAYQKAMALEPLDRRAYLRLAELEITRSQPERAAELLQRVLDQGGPPELLRDAGRQALDLAEAAGTIDDVLNLALARASRRPEAEEPREFLLDAIARMPPSALAKWQSAGSQAVPLRTALLHSLVRGPLSNRLQAAEQLGRLRLPDTAVPLAQVALDARAPRDATPTVQEAYERLALVSLRAAATLDDPKAVALFVRIFDEGLGSQALRHVAAWALIGQGPDPRVPTVLGPLLHESGDPVLLQLACAALGTSPRGRVAAADLGRVAVLARESPAIELRQVCGLAEAALVDDREVGSAAAHFDAEDPVLAAVAAWRLGRVTNPDERVFQQLFAGLLRPGGPTRDAAAAAIAALVRRQPPPRWVRPPLLLRGSQVTVELRPWLAKLLTPPFTPLTTEELAPHRDALAAAVAQARRGTRAERAALDSPCPGHEFPRGRLCLLPLLRQPVPIPGADRD